MTELEIESQFKKLWTKKYYVLVKDGTVDYTIHDEKAGMFVIIDAPEAIPYIINRMIEGNCKIYDSVYDLPKPTVRNKWVSGQDWLKFIEIAKELGLEEEEREEITRELKDHATRNEIIKLVKSRFDRFQSL